MIGLTYDELKNLSPCKDSLGRVVALMGGAKKWGKRSIDAEKARKAGATLDDIVWAASAVARTNPEIERRLRLWLADCAAHVLQHFEVEWPADLCPRNAIIAARQFSRGEIGDAARAAARAAAWDAARAAAWDAARAAAWDAARAAARAAAWAAARAAAGDAAWAAAWDAAWAAARAAEKQWQFDRLILWLSDSEPTDWPLPELEKVEAA
jgi:hypothetical protein